MIGRTADGRFWLGVGDVWCLLSVDDSVVLSASGFEHSGGMVIYEPTILEGLVAGSIIGSIHDPGLVAVKTKDGLWVITQEWMNAFEDDEILHYFGSDVEVVRAVR